MDFLPQNDAIGNALDALVSLGLRRTAEMTMTGFETEYRFDRQWLANVASRHTINVTSLGTNTRYELVVRQDDPKVNSVWCAIIGINGVRNPETSWREMTITRRGDDRMVLYPGWRTDLG